MKLKSILLLSYLLLQGFIINAQSKVDEGVANIRIDQTKDVLEKKLVPINEEDLWKEVLIEDYITSFAKVKAPKKIKFFGMKASRIEIHFTPHYDEELDEENGEDIFEFNIFIEYKSASEHAALLEKVEAAYGPILTYSINDDGSEAPNWFSHITILSISTIEKNGKKYILANYQRGYGY